VIVAAEPDFERDAVSLGERITDATVTSVEVAAKGDLLL
jgi:hypothetical protein